MYALTDGQRRHEKGVGQGERAVSTRKWHRAPAIPFEAAAEPRAKRNGPREGNEAANGMDHGGPGEIMKGHPQGRQEIALTAHRG